MQQAAYRLDPVRGIWQPADRTVDHDYTDADGLENAVRDLILACTDRSTDSAEIHAQAGEWPRSYHLSAARVNVLRPLEHALRGKRVLEIGCGCGVITRWLGETAKSVTALEGSMARAEITALRCTDLTNVTVVADQLAHFQATEKFDVITLVGVLEYAGRYATGDGDPALTLLQQARALLAPGGLLVIAIENQLGVKYFCGAPEDHYGQPMYGINDSYAPRSMRTWGRAALDTLLQQARFGARAFAAALPDYKFTNAVILPDRLTDPLSRRGAAQLAGSCIARDPQLTALPLTAAPERAILPVIENGLLSDMANSFLVVASTRGNARRVFKNDMLAQYMTTGRATPHRKSLIFSRTRNGIQAGDAPYLDGQLWSLELTAAVSRPGWTVDHLRAWLLRWLGAVAQTAGLPGISDLNAIVDGKLLDAVPFNMIVDAQDTAQFFDLEWTASTPLTFGRLAFRGVRQSLSALSGIARPGGETPTGLLALTLAILRQAGLEPTHADIEDYLRQESALQSEVTGRPVTLDVATLENQQLRLFATGPEFLILQRQAELLVAETGRASDADYIGEIHRLHGEVDKARAAQALAEQNLRHAHAQNATREQYWQQQPEVAAPTRDTGLLRRLLKRC